MNNADIRRLKKEPTHTQMWCNKHRQACAPTRLPFFHHFYFFLLLQMQRHKMMIWRGGKRAWEWCVQFPRAPPPRRDFSADSRDVSYIFKTTKRSKRSDERKKNIWPVFFFPNVSLIWWKSKHNHDIFEIKRWIDITLWLAVVEIIINAYLIFGVRRKQHESNGNFWLTPLTPPRININE